MAPSALSTPRRKDRRPCGERTGLASCARRSFLRGVLNADGATVTPLTGQGSHQLGALARANALIVVPEEVASMAAGDEADVISLS